MASAVGHASEEREGDDSEIGDGRAAESESGEDEDGDPEEIEGEKARVRPPIAEELREFALKAGEVFFGEVKALECDGCGIKRQDSCGIRVPVGEGPEKIGSDESGGDEADGGAHVNLLGDGDEEDEGGGDEAVATGEWRVGGGVWRGH